MVQIGTGVFSLRLSGDLLGKEIDRPTQLVLFFSSFFGFFAKLNRRFSLFFSNAFSFIVFLSLF